MASIALQLLAEGRSVAYGGDPRQNGFAEILPNPVVRYRNRPRHRETIVVTGYLAWPTHVRMTPEEIAALSADGEPFARLVFVGRDGTRLSTEGRLTLGTREPVEPERREGLTAMCTAMGCDARARVVLGGRVEGYRGAMPGVAEEVRLSLAVGQPGFLVGRFGGCIRDVAETVGLVKRRAGSRDDWAGRERSCDTAPDDLRNGLTSE